MKIQVVVSKACPGQAGQKWICIRRRAGKRPLSDLEVEVAVEYQMVLSLVHGPGFVKIGHRTKKEVVVEVEVEVVVVEVEVVVVVVVVVVHRT